MNLRGRNKVTPEFNMSSMTDIVFLLLIFFMLTSTMVTTNALDLVLPKAKGKTDSNKSISISIDKDLKFYLDKTPIEEASVEAQLLAALGGDKEKPVILRAEEGVPIEKAVYVMDIANRNQIKIVLAVRPK
ncbi:MAG: biopolymer transporter ExbD [Flavobacterium sp.]|jgi:biopolymer transport protein ExbD|uniref:Biopolymer transporter ExbD n=3 Tax=Flavobacterium TaxID=237 RepID=A0ABS2CWD7_9FLAO|nr:MULTISPECIES: biopolymer transporter ExbD [Flavobacterium]PZO28393.1 MAG: biopolymer transporter ExbD [Flavobacteriaceae bacterium]MBM6499278.1 biopolymer transporter ExbD [Flavobacterium macrobrachii]MCZ8089191.1 biopolymer transporter ExbD [Flavobacterium sp.]MCZ8329826.1 biopolymer transporter ExbD [Flavobacterium sp.]NMH24325.1 biopolymer transporter ExbD [Flavobacterium solisilvae]